MDNEELKKQITDSVLKALEGVEPSEQDKSVMIKLTPVEIKNMMRMAVEKCTIAAKHNSHLSVEEIIGFHYDIAVAILAATDKDRFVYSS